MFVDSRFQSTHPQGCDVAGSRQHRSVPGFNPRTRKGATPTRAAAANARLVSIHAPARVRLSAPGRADFVGPVSIHAPARVRQGPRRAGQDRTGVSIHAPARVRRLPPIACQVATSFNPRTRKGATEPLPAPAPAFQSTHPQGCDGCGQWITLSVHSFNPRTRKGATRPAHRRRRCHAVSIHAPARVRRSVHLRV